MYISDGSAEAITSFCAPSCESLEHHSFRSCIYICIMKLVCIISQLLYIFTCWKSGQDKTVHGQHMCERHV